MTDPTNEATGEWFDCINVGDDSEEKDDRRADGDLTIPGYSVVEVVGNRIVNGDDFVYEVRLHRPNTGTTNAADADFIPSSANQCFTSPQDIPKGHRGRFQFSPAYVRFKGTLEDTKKIFGTYKAPPRVAGGKYTDAEHDEFDAIEERFGQGNKSQLFGSPGGYLQIKPHGDNSSIQFEQGWDVLGAIKRKTGEKSENDDGVKVFEDEDETMNLLVMVSPAAPAPPPSVIFLTKEDITNEEFQAGLVPVEFLEYVDPRSPKWNYKSILDFSGVFGHEFEFEIRDGKGNYIGPFYITSDGDDIKTAIEGLGWCGAGNVRVQTPGTRTGRFIIEFIKDLAGLRLDAMSFQWRRIINITDPPPENLLGGVPEIPPRPLVELPEYDYRIIPGDHSVNITPASRPLNNYRRWYGSGYWYNNGYYGYNGLAGWNYGYGYYAGGRYGYYGGWGGGPFGYYGGGYYGAIDYYGWGDTDYYGPNGYNHSYYIGPFSYDADGNLSASGEYNIHGFNSNGYNSEGYDPAGFDVNGLNADGDAWGYYGVWGHLHTSLDTHAAGHKNDHGISNYYNNTAFQHTAAGSFGVASWVRGGGYVVVGLEPREFWLHISDDDPERSTTY